MSEMTKVRTDGAGASGVSRSVDSTDAVETPLSTSLASGGVEKKVAGMMGALLTRLDAVTGGEAVSALPEPPVPVGAEVEAGASFAAMRRAPAVFRECAASGEWSGGEREVIERAAEVVEVYAEMRADVVFRAG